ncbi:MAG: c-type cytochrome [Sphingomonadales bacterium]
MDSFEWNKIFGAVLLSALVIFVIDLAVDEVLAPGAASHNAHVAAAPESETVPAEELVTPPEVAAVTPDEAPALDEAGPDGAQEETPSEIRAQPVAVAGSPDAGKKLFKKCATCHTANKGGKRLIGPNLWGIAGAPMAIKEGFRYSSALKKAGGVWDDQSLDAWLADPKAFIAGNKMTFRGIKDTSDRADLIAYMKTLSD